MPSVPGSYIEGELIKRKEELAKLKEDKIEYLSDLRKLSEDSEQTNKKKKSCPRNSLSREEIEWDLHLTECGIKEKLKNIEELQTEGALNKIIDCTKIDLENNKRALAKAIEERRSIEDLSRAEKCALSADETKQVEYRRRVNKGAIIEFESNIEALSTRLDLLIREEQERTTATGELDNTDQEHKVIIPQDEKESKQQHR